MSETLPNWLLKRAELTPERIALCYENESITFQQLHEKAVQTANKLAALHVKKGDHVAVILKNTKEAVFLLFGLQYIGAVAVLLNTRLSAAELEWQIHDANASILIYDEEYSAKAASIHFQSALNMQSLQQATPYAVSANIQQEFQLNDCHSIIYTSGTTGKPKGVMLTYGNHWWSAIGSSLNLGIFPTDRWLCFLPIFHVSGLSIFMRSVIYGMTVVLHKQFHPEAVYYALKEYQISHISVVSATLQQLLKTIRQNGDQQFPHLRCVLLGGGPAPLPLLEEAKELRIPVYQSYGMTETASQIVTLSPEYMFAKLGSAGKPLFPAQLKIERLGAEQIGEIVVKGPNVTTGYYNRPEATKQAIKDGWLYTGDLGYLDEDGFLYVVDRRSDLIISGGENIYPAEIEEILLSHPNVEEAAVIGKEDETWGKVPVAFIVANAHIAEAALTQFCEEKLAKYKVPKEIYFISELPKNATNKILRRELYQYLQ